MVLLAAYGILIALSITFADEEANVDYVGFGLLARFFPVFMMGVMANHMKEAFNRLVHLSLIHILEGRNASSMI